MLCSLLRSQPTKSINIIKRSWIFSQIYSFCHEREFGSIKLDEHNNDNKYKHKVGIMSHPSCLFHEIPNHPESPQRLKIILDYLNNPEIKGEEEDFSTNLEFFDDPTQITRSRITMAHSQIHVDDIMDKTEESSEQNKLIEIDPDTFISPYSAQSIMYAPACVCHAIDIVLNNEQYKHIKRTFCAIRPPGHHAEYDRAMGFCVFNNIFIGAKYAQYLFGELFDNHNTKIAIIDFDVHHGNGTQALSWNEQNILYISLHQYDGEGIFYPGTGSKEECGAFDNVLNIPFNEGANSDDIKNAFNEKIIPKLNTFEPNLIMISAGFDGHVNDDLANLNYVEKDYEWMTQQIVNIANQHCDGKIISVLEGGYNLDSLKKCVVAHVKALCV
eukprot:394622_1